MSAIADHDAFYGGDPVELQRDQETVSAEERAALLSSLLALPIEKLQECAIAAMDALDAAEFGGASPADIEALQAYAEECQRALLTKPDRYVGLMKHIDAQETQLVDEIKRLQNRKKAFAGKRERLEARLLAFVQSLPNKRIETALHTISEAKKPARVNVTNLDAVPEFFKNHIPEQTVITPARVEADTKAILAYIKTGKTVEGAELIQEYRLQVR